MEQPNSWKREVSVESDKLCRCSVLNRRKGIVRNVHFDTRSAKYFLSRILPQKSKLFVAPCCRRVRCPRDGSEPQEDPQRSSEIRNGSRREVAALTERIIGCQMKRARTIQKERFVCNARSGPSRPLVARTGPIGCGSVRCLLSPDLRCYRRGYSLASSANVDQRGMTRFRGASSDCSATCSRAPAFLMLVHQARSRNTAANDM